MDKKVYVNSFLFGSFIGGMTVNAFMLDEYYLLVYAILGLVGFINNLKLVKYL